jgi:hypothetical protein
MEHTTGHQDTHEREIHTSSRTQLAPASMITGLIGLVLLVVGLIVIIRGGFEGSMSEPVVNVFGFTHTTTLGLIEIGIGLFLLVSAATYSRSGQLFFGAVLGVAGIIGAVQTDSFDESLALESGMAWIAAAAGLIIVAAVLLLPRYGRSTTSITHV